jgi:hypothetical protein
MAIASESFGNDSRNSVTIASAAGVSRSSSDTIGLDAGSSANVNASEFNILDTNTVNDAHVNGAISQHRSRIIMQLASLLVLNHLEKVTHSNPWQH